MEEENSVLDRYPVNSPCSFIYLVRWKNTRFGWEGHNLTAESWHEARLIPTSGIGSALEQELRATSALLAVIGAVQDFGRAVLKPCGAPAGKIKTYAEVPFQLDKRKVRPDGLIRVERGKRQWTALVEVKTANNLLEEDQVQSYIDVAKEQSFDAVITISNEIPPVLGSHPLALDKRKTKGIGLYHFSWVRLISIAVMEKEVHGIEDPEQSWILGELIRYLEHDNSGALEFNDMGGSWTTVREAVRKGVIRKNDPEVEEVAVKFDALIRYLCLRLGQRLGAEVLPRLSRRHQQYPQERTAVLVSSLAEESCLGGEIRIPDTVGDLSLRCDLRAQQIQVSVSLPASGHAKNETRVRWLLRQLPDDLEDIVIEASSRGRSRAASVEELRESEAPVVPDSGREITKFTVTKLYPLGAGRSTRAKSSFISSMAGAVDDFYSRVLQNLKTWNPPAPKLRAKPEERQNADQYVSTDLSSMDDELTMSEPSPRPLNEGA